MKYEFILMDMDGTLFDFDTAERNAFTDAMNAHHLPYTEQVMARFHTINEQMWRLYEQGTLSRSEVQLRRYHILFEQYGWNACAESVNEIYKHSLQQSTLLIDGAAEVCRTLAVRHKLYIVTNGALSQRTRLRDAGLAPYFSDVFISEEMGCRKPEKKFFDMAAERAGIQNKNACLVVGDSPTSDIAGAKRAGMDSCLFSKEEISCGCMYRIETLTQLCQIADGDAEQ